MLFRSVETGHDGNQLLGQCCNALHTTQEDEAGHNRDDDTGHQLGHTECGIEGIADGVGLNHVAHEAQCQDNGHCEEGSHEGTDLTLESSLDVVDGATGNSTVFVHGLELLSQNRFAVDGSHAEESGQPHPEHGTGTTGYQSGCTAGNITGTNLSRNGGCQSLERAHAFLARCLTLQADVAEDQAHTFTELPDLDEIGTDGKEDAAAQQQEQQ